MSTWIDPDSVTTVTQGVLVRRATATTAADQDLFSIDTGRILLVGFMGHVTTAIGGGSQDFEIDFDPDDGGTNVALSTLVAVDADVTGTYYTLNTTFGGALVATLDYAPNFILASPFVLDVGDIVLDVTGTEAGSVEWDLVYAPIDAGAAVTAT
jgi:hypothetical protein